MKDSQIAKIVLAEAIVQSLWIQGYISIKERDEICQRSKKRLIASE